MSLDFLPTPPGPVLTKQEQQHRKTRVAEGQREDAKA